MNLLPKACSLLLLTAFCSAQNAAFVPFGAGCTFESQTLAIGNVGLPRIGQTFRITYSGPNYTFNFAQQIAWPNLGLGFQQQTIQLPTNLLPRQPAGCVGQLRPDAMLQTQQTSTGTFAAFFDITIPNDQGLLGVLFLAQWLTLHQQCGFAGCDFDAVLLSDAAFVVIGN